MQITVKTIEGGVFQLTVQSETTIADLKRQLETVSNVPVSTQRIIFRGKVLTDQSRLTADCGVEDGSVLHLVKQKPPTPSSSTSPSLQQPSLNFNSTTFQQQNNISSPLGRVQVVVSPVNRDLEGILNALTSQIPQMTATATQTQTQQQQNQVPLPSESLESVMQDAMNDLLSANTSTDRSATTTAPPTRDTQQTEMQRQHERMARVFSHIISQIHHSTTRNPNNEASAAPRMSDMLNSISTMLGQESTPDNKVEKLLSVIADSLTLPELLEMVNGNWKSLAKIHTVARKWLFEEVGNNNGNQPTRNQLEDFVNEMISEIKNTIKDETLPNEIKVRVKPGCSLVGSSLSIVEKYSYSLLELVITTVPNEESDSFAKDIGNWNKNFIVALIDTISTSLIGGVSDAEIVVRYFVYTLTSSGNQEMAFISSNMLTQKIMQIYHDNISLSTLPIPSIPFGSTLPPPGTTVESLMRSWQSQIEADENAMRSIPSTTTPLSDAYKLGSPKEHFHDKF